jgi:inosose dehydratase
MSITWRPPSPIKIGIQPTGWTNDDFQEIGDEIPYETILDQTRDTGYQGGSMGHNYPTHLPSLQFDLRSRGLVITNTLVGTEFTAPGRYEAALEMVRKQIAFLKVVGSTDIVVAELAAAVNTERTKAVLTDRPHFNEPQKYLLYRGLNAAGKLAADAGVRLSYHPHVGTGVQQASEASELLKRTDPSLVWLCLDTGHVKFAGDDPVDFALNHTTRIGHIHLKSVRPEIVKAARDEQWSFYEAIMEGVFTVPDDPAGSIDFAPIFAALKKSQYHGWIVVEAEQDPAKANPLQCARTAREFIKCQY